VVSIGELSADPHIFWLRSPSLFLPVLFPNTRSPQGPAIFSHLVVVSSMGLSRFFVTLCSTDPPSRGDRFPFPSSFFPLDALPPLMCPRLLAKPPPDSSSRSRPEIAYFSFSPTCTSPPVPAPKPSIAVPCSTVPPLFHPPPCGGPPSPRSIQSFEGQIRPLPAFPNSRCNWIASSPHCCYFSPKR